MYGFFASDKLEPYVIVSAISAGGGRLSRLTHAQLDALLAAIGEFKSMYGISDEKYHYTSLGERQETDRFVGAGGADKHSKAHSSHFHVKIRVATRMYEDAVGVLRLVDFGRLRTELEPVAYNYSREAMGRDAAERMMREDCIGTQ